MVIDLRGPNCTFGREDCLVKYKLGEDDSFDELEEGEDGEEMEVEEEEEEAEEEGHFDSTETE